MTAHVTIKPTPAEILQLLGATVVQVAKATGLSESATHDAIFGGNQRIHEETARYIAESMGMKTHELHWPSELTNVGRPPLTGGKYDRIDEETIGELCEQHYLFKSKTGTCSECVA